MSQGVLFSSDYIDEIKCLPTGGDDSNTWDAGVFPLSPPKYSEAITAFNDLKNLQAEDIIKKGEWFSRSNIKKQLPLYFGIDRTGSKASDYFHWSSRMACDSLNSPSPVRSWYDRKIKKSVMGSKFFAESPKTALALRKYIPAQFRPSAALAIYKYFGAEKVYDPCGGWGDRLAAAMAAGVEYHCRDVNPLVFTGYCQQEQELPHIAPVSFEMRGSEVDAPTENYFDLVFTSPPYWKIEKYQGDDQSFKKYKKVDEWINGFLIPMLENSLESLKSGGIMAINISDVYANHTVNELCAPVIDYMSANMEFLGVAGYQMAKRPNSKSQALGVYCEPIVIGKKN